MFKKHACYLSLWLLAAPLVALADDLPQVAASPVQDTPAQLTVACPGLATRFDLPTQQLLQAFYHQHGEQPAWAVEGRLGKLQAQLAQMVDDGLDPGRYHLPPSSAASDGLCTDIDITHQYLQALQDLHYGRLSQTRFEPLWRAQPLPDNRQSVLLAIAVPGLEDLAAAFDQARPSLEQYRNLRQAYAHERQQPLPHWQAVAGGPLLRPHMQDKRVPELAQRLYHGGFLQSPSVDADNTYGGELVDAVKSFQLSHSLQADGVIGAGTLKELNVSPALRREQLRINLERLRWMAQDFEPNIVLVNVAAAHLSFYQHDAVVWQTRTQVGRAERQTPLLKSQVTRLTLNPTWTVPPTILKEDKLPEIRRDQGFLNRQNLQVLDANGQPLAAADIDWDRPGNILLRQGAGPRNPLGRIAIRFPNPFSVYLHDTPSQALFSKGPRAFSSGCVRVEQALQLRDWLLSPAERLRTNELLATGVTHEFRLAKPVPILLSYWTVQADSHGQLLYAPDIYGHDEVLSSALGTKI
ncbi:MULTISPECIES: L,D-transpeptidase family protein [unclassified Pseudomonas]|uniref:L,D-transpeptidase family protein n=1 Tax=unclassified Pseudomonas TaxID=196821 RepID=UPI000838B3A3|nr:MULTISPECIES: L,D-transpeptidase family protein [unclassified Pseudomonas]QIH08821.1 L,D-transpeptidase family protein [Pseudomonas sp. BIOMIG1BAC]